MKRLLAATLLATTLVFTGCVSTSDTSTESYRITPAEADYTGHPETHEESATVDDINVSSGITAYRIPEKNQILFVNGIPEADVAVGDTVILVFDNISKQVLAVRKA